MVTPAVQPIVVVGTQPRITDDNPDTWVRRAWEGSPLIESEMPPAGLSETEWYILRLHVYFSRGYLTIKQSFSEPVARIRGFAEDATRRVIPDRALSAEADFRGGVGATPEARAHVALMTNAHRAYAAIGSPLGGAPEDIAAFFGWLADDPAVLEAIRGVIQQNVISVDRAPVAPEVVTVGADGGQVEP